jgi:hypothetical protein
MAVSDFPLLSQVERHVFHMLDEPLDSTGQLTWDREAEFNLAANAEFLYLLERIQSLDRDWLIKVVDTPTVSSGDRLVTLPDDVRSVRAVYEIKSAGLDESKRIDAGSWSDLGTGYDSWIYRPDTRELYFTTNPTDGATLRVVYNSQPPPLAHGFIVGGSSFTVLLAEHEPDEDDILNGRTIFFVDGSGDTLSSANRTQVLSSYTGPTRFAIMTPGTGTAVIDTTTKYTSRPELPRGAYDAFVYGICSRLLEKLEDERYVSFAMNREKHLQHLKTEIMQQEKATPIQTNDETEGQHSGEIWDYFQ